MSFETQEQAERWAENMEFRADQAREEMLLRSADVEVKIPSGEAIVSEQAEKSIRSAAKLIAAGANAETVIRTVYLFGFMDGMQRS